MGGAKRKFLQGKTLLIRYEFKVEEEHFKDCFREI